MRPGSGPRAHRRWLAFLASLAGLSGSAAAAPEPGPPAHSAVGASAAGSTGAASAAGSTAETFVVDHIELRGVTFSRKPALAGRLGFAVGDTVDDAAVAEARIALLASGLFHAVTPRLAKGAARGRVRIIFECEERTTASIDALHLGHARPTNLWGGFEVSDLDPFGVGWSLDAGLVASGDQLGVRLGSGPRNVFNTPLILHFRLHALYGDEPFVGPTGQRLAGVEVEQVAADYRRLGGGADLSLPLGDHSRLTLAVTAERFDFEAPLEAEQRDLDGATRPFVFNASPGWLKLVGVNLSHDSRDDPAFPTRGTRAALRLQAGHLGGGFVSAQGSVERSWRLPFGHVVRADATLGAVLGAAPFYERFFIGDLHPWIPARALGLNFARRRGPNLLSGPIDAQRYEQVAGRVGLEYRLPLAGRTASNPYGVELFVGTGLLGLGSLDAVEADGRLPLDLAFDLGLRIESKIGVMGLSLSNLFLLVDP